MNEIAFWLINRSISAMWLILAVIFVRLLTDLFPVLRAVPKRFRGVLWGLVTLRLVLPFTLETSISLVPDFGIVTAESLQRDFDTKSAPDTEEEHTYIYTVEEENDNRVISEVSTDYLPAEVITAETSLQTEPFLQRLSTKIGIFWVCGTAALLLYALVSYLRLRKRTEVTAHLFEQIYLCDGIDAPFILGIFRPRILLPAGMDADTSGYVIAHEKAHLKHHDQLWKPLGYLLLAIYWFQPLLWIAYLLFCRDVELMCDERVIRGQDTAYKRAYSEALLQCSMPGRMLSACPLAFGETPVKSRIRSVMSYQKPTRWILLVAAVVGVLLAVCFLTNPVRRYRLPEQPIEFVAEDRGEYMAFVWEEKGKTYVPFGPLEPRYVGDCIGYADFAGDAYTEGTRSYIFTLQGYPAEEWIIETLDLKNCREGMIFREVGTTAIPEGLFSEPEYYRNNMTDFEKETADTDNRTMQDNSDTNNIKNEITENRIDTAENTDDPSDAAQIGVVMTLKNLTPTGATVEIVPTDRSRLTGDLMTGQRYEIQVRRADEGWVDVDLQVAGNIVWEDIAYLPKDDGSIEAPTDWGFLYGELTPGAYRLVKEIMDFRGTGDYDTYTCYAEFEITELETGSVKMRNSAWVMPVDNPSISGYFGELPESPSAESRYSDHVNFKGEIGDPVYAVANAVVEEAVNEAVGIYGHYIVLRIDNNTTAMYGHLDEILVEPRQTVRKGEQIGTIGQTGMATGPNLSLTVYLDGVPVDPLG